MCVNWAVLQACALNQLAGLAGCACAPGCRPVALFLHLDFVFCVTADKTVACMMQQLRLLCVDKALVQFTKGRVCSLALMARMQPPQCSSWAVSTSLLSLL